MIRICRPEPFGCKANQIGERLLVREEEPDMGGIGGSRINDM